MIPGSTDPECEAVMEREWVGGGWCGRLGMEEGRGMDSWAVPPSHILPSFSLCHYRSPLTLSTHTHSHLFYLLLLSQLPHPSPVHWLE